MKARVFTLVLFATVASCLLLQTAGNYSHAKQQSSKTKKESSSTTKANKSDAEDITTRRSDKDKSLDKLKDKLYPDETSGGKQAAKPKDAVKKSQDVTPPKSPDNKTIVNNLINMKAEEIEKVKQNQLSKIRTDSSIAKKDKKKLIAETTKFYDTLKKLPQNEREAFVSNFSR